MHRLRVVTWACTLQSSVPLAATAFLFVACLAGFGAHAETIALGARAPSPTVLSLVGTDTASAKIVARLTQADYDACVTGGNQACSPGDLRPGRRFTLTADCVEGSIVDVDGRRYVRDGSWERGDLFSGRPRFRDAAGTIVSTANASVGGALAVNYEVLCPGASRRAAVRPASAWAKGSHGTQTQVEVVDLNGLAGNYFDHNGSIMRVDGAKGLIVYDTPKASIRKSIRPGTVLFRGRPWNGQDPEAVISGRARVFKAGCDPVEYEVRGHYRSGFVNVFSLEGTAPVRSKTSCAVTGASINSPNAKLLFEPHLGAEL